MPAASTGESAASDDPEAAAGPETDFTRKRKLASVKREQCLAVGSAIQQAQQQDIILNVNDSTAMLRIADALTASAKNIVGEAAELDELRQLRDDYARNLDEMAAALTQAASARGERERKTPIRRFHEREARTGSLIEQLNDYCNAPID